MARKYIVKVNKKNNCFIIFENENLKDLKSDLEKYLLKFYPEIEEIKELEKSTWHAYKNHFEHKIFIKE